MSTKNFVSREQADNINAREGGDMAVPVGEKFLVIPEMPEAYENKQGRVIRANLRMHINNHISGMGLKPATLPKKEAVIKSSDVLTADQIEALDALIESEPGIELANEKVGDIAKAIKMKIGGNQIKQYLAR